MAICFFAMVGLFQAGTLAGENAQRGRATIRKDVHWAWSAESIKVAGEGFWPQLHGSMGTNIAEASGLPSHWSLADGSAASSKDSTLASTNVAWSTPIEGQGWSSPIVWGDRIFVTTAANDGTTMSLVMLDRFTGRVIRNQVVFRNAEVQPDHHVTNSYASPTPTTDGRNVYVHFGAYGTAAISIESGDVLWQRQDLPCNHYRGPGSSPILYDNLLIFHMDGFDFQYAIALDTQSGETVWRAKRNIDYGTDYGDVFKAYATPLVVDIGGSRQLISPTSKATLFLNVETGADLWQVTYDEFSAAARPFFDSERIYLNTGFGKAHLICLRPSETENAADFEIQWTATKGIGSKPSQLLYEGIIYSADDRGIFSTIDSATGETIWKERLGGEFSATPLIADGRIYLFDHAGAGYVFELGREPNQLAENKFPIGCRASPLAIGNRLYVRTETTLYCLAGENVSSE
jgi:outer membrane protein assembly factor BamB